MAKKAPAAAKKPVKASASTKSAKAPTKPVALKAAKTAPKPAAPVKEKAPEKKAAAAKPGAPKPAAPAPKAGVEKKPVQAAETSEKIKVDKNMSDEQVKWVEMYNKYRDAQAAQYDMKSSFKSASPIQHKVLGWGWIVSNENDRLEVLFKDGKRMLISNYK